MADAADAVPGLLGHRLTACEGLDSRIVDVVRRRRGAGSVPPLPEGAGWLFTEVTGDSAQEAAARATAVAADASALDHRVVPDAVEQAALWRIREDGAGLAARSLDRPAQSGWEDAAVPPESLGGYLRAFDDLLRGYGYNGMPYGHFGEGCVHVRIDFRLDSSSGRGGFRSFLEEAAGLVASYGGSLSGEHGDGRARSELLPKMYSSAAIDLFAAVKSVFDPDNLLNPGVLVAPARFAGRRRTPLHGCGQMSGGQHRQRWRDVSLLPGHPGREGLHARPGPGAPGDGRRTGGRRRMEVRRGARGARPLPLLQGMCHGLSHRRGHGHLQGRGSAPEVPPPTASGEPLRPGSASAVGQDEPTSGATGQPGAAFHGAAAGGQGGRRRRPKASAADVCRRVVPGLGPQDVILRGSYDDQFV